VTFVLHSIPENKRKLQRHGVKYGLLRILLHAYAYSICILLAYAFIFLVFSFYFTALIAGFVQYIKLAYVSF